MVIVGCPCRNVLIHYDNIQSTETAGMSTIQLTLDGITIRQSFLTQEVPNENCTTVQCKVCNCPVYHKSIDQSISIQPEKLTDYSTLPLSSLSDRTFKLVLPDRVPVQKEQLYAQEDLALLSRETVRIKSEMKADHDERIAAFVRREEKVLAENLHAVEEASEKLRGLLNSYHSQNPLPSSPRIISPAPSLRERKPSRDRKHSAPERKVTFSISEDTTIPTRGNEDEVDVLQFDNEEEGYKSLGSQDELIFDLNEGDVFGSPEAEDDRYPSLEDRSEEESGGEETGESSSSGCEPDIDMSKSVPINLPMNYSTRREARARAKTPEARSFVELWAHRSEDPTEDIPRPRVTARSYSSSTSYRPSNRFNRP